MWGGNYYCSPYLPSHGLKMHRLLVLLAILYVVHCAQARALRAVDEGIYQEINYLLQERASKQVIHPIPTEVSNWPAEDLKIGQVTGVAVDKDGNPVIFHRADVVWNYDSFNWTNYYTQVDKGPIAEATILKLDRETGKILEERGKKRFYMPHGLTIDQRGNLWLTDVALHQIFMFPPNTDEPALTLGEAFIPGDDSNHFCKPTQVAVASSGDFFVSDGYCNSRIIKYSSTGTFLNQWTKIEGFGSFLIPHSLVYIEERDLLCVADREKKRIVGFPAEYNDRSNTEMAFEIRDWKIGRMFGIAHKGNYLFAVTGPTLGLSPTGLTVDLNTKQVVNNWAPKEGFVEPHDIAVSPDGKDIYVGEIYPDRIIKFKTTE